MPFAEVSTPVHYESDTRKKLGYMAKFSTGESCSLTIIHDCFASPILEHSETHLSRVIGIEMMRSIIDHKKVFVLALNGSGVGGGAAWFQGVADIVLAAQGSYLQSPFNALGLVPENGSAISFAQSIGVHRSNDFHMFGRKLTVEELEQWGLINRIFPVEGFQESVVSFLQEQLAVNDGKSMMETKRLQNAPIRDARMIAVYNSMEALGERFVDNAPLRRFEEKRKFLACKSSLKISTFLSLSVSGFSIADKFVVCAHSQKQEPIFQNLNLSRACEHSDWVESLA